MNTLELRFPLIGDTIGGVMYHDMGNVFSDLDKISFRTSQKAYGTLTTPCTPSAGIRYRTPVGPVRFDIGYSPITSVFRLQGHP
jgi:outer membrane translocation and assembly module TamA